ncbi:MAG: hypothetical protein GY725_17245 [bacterium]|nr:hypothetical protein [bacterium]
MGNLCVPVYFDFASSICFIAHTVMERMKPDLAQLEIELKWLPVDLTRFSSWKRGARSKGVGSENVRRVSRDLTVLGDDSWLLELQEQTERCVEAEVTGVPTFMLDGWPIGGIQTDDTMRDLLGRFAAKMQA